MEQQLTSQEDRPQINIIWVGLWYWSMDDHGSQDSSGVLGRVMGMIPRGAIDVRAESVSEGTARRNWALRNRWNTIIPRSSFLKEAMPLESTI
jgi:hypothetical protein